MEFLIGAAATVIAKLPAIIGVCGDVAAVVGAIEAGDSIYQIIKAKFPQVSDAIDNLAKIFPKSPAITEAQHLDNVAKALFSDFSYTLEQKKALAPYLPKNTGGGSLGYNEQATRSVDQ